MGPNENGQVRMKDIRFNVSLYIIIPFIFAGIALLSIIVTYSVTEYYFTKGFDPEWPVVAFGVAMVSITFICGLLIAKMLLGPVEQFVLKAQRLGILKNLDSSKDETEGIKDGGMGRFTVVFNQVTELLSRVESQKLFPQIIGQSKAMRGVLNQIKKVASTESNVLIMGETGTGKELITKSIHENSKRQGKPFVAINCAAIPEGLLESELFGHEKGAFTGANERKLGKFELANGGTIFMDEIGDMPLETQAKVLRVIEDSQFERVGGVRLIKVDVRFIAATNKDLSRMVEAEQFRQDLFYRLNVFSVHLPPLRERKEDIATLIEEFLRQRGKNLPVSSDAMQILTTYGWPGNVRELQNVVESASVLAEKTIEPSHLPPYVTKELNTKIQGEDQNLDHRLRELEKGIIIEALSRTGGQQRRAAKILGISERSLWHRINKFEIDVASFKN